MCSHEKWVTDVTELKVQTRAKTVSECTLIYTTDIRLHMLSVPETTTNLYLNLDKALATNPEAKNHSFTVTEDSNTPAKYFKENSRNTRWNNQCHELVGV